ncbi:sulfotransferase family protein [Rivularia sp. PCC 7116]|uniref:sulfotransferase domain-containing protein n=1 Tax=Rivularia sp. PCC 7116 TaxID=373994 RepID=UPI00029F4D83|nr:sulfotransferase domain-containing protein [Rivularia sp. PCC 7116]AFY54851.1 sulfotransferase family protein [Rivularia sp. PCC 7116]
MKHSLPHFLIIGAMKSGTTSLYDDLKTSPLFHLPDTKEPAVLVKTKTIKDAVRQYELHFENSNDTRIRGDGSTYYMMQPLFPDVSKFAKTVCGSDLKLVAILRNPIDRIISHVCHDYAAGRLKHRDVDRAIADDFRYVAFSNYTLQLKPWIESFGIDSLYCISFEDYIKNRLAVSRKIASFIEVEPSTITPRRKISNRNSDIRLPLIPGKTLEIYRSYLKKITPPFVQKAGFNLFTQKRKVLPEVKFSQKLKDELHKHFSEMEDNLCSLTGKKINLNLE